MMSADRSACGGIDPSFIRQMKEEISRLYDELREKLEKMACVERELVDTKSKLHQSSAGLKEADTRISCLQEKIANLEMQSAKDKAQCQEKIASLEMQLTKDKAQCQKDLEDRERALNFGNLFRKEVKRVKELQQVRCCMARELKKAEDRVGELNARIRKITEDDSLFDAARRGDEKEVRRRLEVDEDVDKRKIYGHKTPLMIASEKGHIAVVKLLIQAGADIHAYCDKTMMTSLMLATENQHIKVVEALLEAGARPNDKNINHETALMTAVRHGCLATVRLLLAAGADVSAVDQYYNTNSLLLATKHSNPQIVEALLQAGAQPNHKNNMGETALMRAARSGCLASVRLLLAAGANVSVVDRNGRTPLIYAAERPNPLIVEALLQAGAQPDIKARNKETALMAAARYGHLANIRLLLSAGADPCLQDNEGKTALKFSKKYKKSFQVRIVLAGAERRRRGQVASLKTHCLDAIALTVSQRGNLYDRRPCSQPPANSPPDFSSLPLPPSLIRRLQSHVKK